MNNWLGIIIIFLIQLFFIHLGILDSLTPSERKESRKKYSIAEKISAFYVFKLRERLLNKILTIVIYLMLFLNLYLNLFAVIFTSNTVVVHLFDITIKLTFAIIPLILIANYFGSKK